ncbi:dihydrofolate reductase [Desulfoprunum benzoelyticum]|uniref:Dihydrofolate reductase n=1 Tax=Desulfoprunum benzoelyticum TaxID=1506996 RepID=A0A840UR72_9BACT|nr:dihydrofolate reductase [Desulfoprunum benzoelyticum]MBB5348145.1 dihydrofolate reductase [Desulfoprunum benzoelyticum]MBM9530245.1 dihydrofolate reductase [Desulfoprunum benzoelyticum]
MDILLIAVMAANRTIGKNGAIPWHIPEELGFFKATTMGHPIIMGRRTFDSLSNGALPGRENIVLSRNPDFAPPGVVVVPTLERALAHCAGQPRVFIIGGAQIFRKALSLATGIILSVIDQVVDGDTFFPEFDPQIFQETTREQHLGSQPFTVITYHRVNP